MRKSIEGLIEQIEEQLMKYNNGEIRIILKVLELWALTDYIKILVNEQLKESKSIK